MRTSLIFLASAGLALAACNSKQEGETVGQKVDKAIATTQSAAEQAKENAKRGLDQAAQTTKEKSEQLSKKADELSKKAEVIGQKVNDATITAAVKSDIAKDPDLSALRIDVDTNQGKVSLSGTAPNAAAKERAQQIALKEKGVTGVENRLQVASR
jgi:hyperosmotically inducible protein